MIRRLLFDLDNTLYPSTNPMEAEILDRMNAFVAHWLSLELPEAVEYRRAYMPKYGTTLEWLMAEHGLTDVEGYYRAVHPEGEQWCIEPNPPLRDLLRSMPYPKSIFTNAPSEHARRVLDKLGVAGEFDRVFDIRFHGLKGKPDPAAIRRVCAALAVEPSECVFIDDQPRYVRGFQACGGHGVLYDDAGRYTMADMPRIDSLFTLRDLLASGEFEHRQNQLFEFE
jgi:putative hydrolase of the HAD superfamily